MSNSNRVIATPARIRMAIDHEASKAHGRRMYKHTPVQPKDAPTPSTPTSTNTVRFKSWVSVYRVFTSIADTVLELPEGIDHNYAHALINSCVNTLYAQHTGEDAWDIAYTKWIEPSDDDPEV